MSDELLPKLKDRDQWVCWTYEERDGDRTKPPIAPFGGEHYASSTNPETWGSYEQAVEYHKRGDTDTEGDGFVVSERDMVVGIDLDGCHHPETGEIEPWAEGIMDMIPTYWEVSPSQTGLRGFLFGVLPEGRNRRQQERTLDMPEWVEEEKSPEVEIYDSGRYMTFTGKHIDGTPTEAREAPQALKDVHAEYVADESDDTGENDAGGSFSLSDDESDDSGSARYTNEFGTSLEQIREWSDRLDAALSDIEPDYSIDHDEPSPSEYDLSAASMLYYWRFSESDIARILRKKRDREKLKRADYVERTINKAIGGEQCDPPHSRDVDEEETTEEEAAAMLRATLSSYEGDDEEEPSPAKRRRLGKLLAIVDGDEFADLQERAADVLGTKAAYLEEHRRLMDHKLRNGRLLVENGATYYLAGTPLQKHEILNFELEVKSFLEVSDEPKRAELAITPPEGDEFEKRIEPKVFNERQRFEDEIADEFGMTFDPGTRSGKEVLDDVNTYVASRDAPVRRGTHHMGLHGDEFVTPAGSLTADGWTDDPTTVYLDRELGIERAVGLPADRDDYDDLHVSRILRDLPHTRDVSRSVPVLGWFYAAPFRPYIYDWEGGFNILNVTGDTGSGKTTTLRYLWRCFGMAGEPFDVRDTWFVLLSTFGATNSIPVWHDEYKPSDMTKREVDRFHDALRKTATGSTAQRGNADKSTTEYHLAAPAVVSGEQQIQPPAERRRSVMVNFRTAVTEEGTDTRRRFKELVGSGIIEDGELVLPEEAPDPTDHALAYYEFVAGKDKAEVRELWLDAREKVWEIRESWDAEFTLDDMEIQGLQTVAFGWMLMREFAEAVGVEFAELPTEADLRAGLRHVAESVGPQGARRSHLDRFVELFERAKAAGGYLEEGTHYTFVHEGKPEEELRINLSRAYDALSMYARDHDLATEDLLDASAYKDRFETAADEDGSYVTCYGQNTPPINRCVGISTIKVMNQLEFNRATFQELPEMGRETGTVEDDGPDGGGGGPSASSDDSAGHAAADGGQPSATGATVEPDAEGGEADRRRLRHTLAQRGGVLQRGELLAAAAEDWDLDPESAKHALDQGLQKGDFYEPTSDEIRLIEN